MDNPVIRTFTPRGGNTYGRPHKVRVITMPDDLSLKLEFANNDRSWSSDVKLDDDEVALLAKLLVEHLEFKALHQRAERSHDLEATG